MTFVVIVLASSATDLKINFLKFIWIISNIKYKILYLQCSLGLYLSKMPDTNHEIRKRSIKSNTYALLCC